MGANGPKRGPSEEERRATLRVEGVAAFSSLRLSELYVPASILGAGAHDATAAAVHLLTICGARLARTGWRCGPGRRLGAFDRRRNLLHVPAEHVKVPGMQRSKLLGDDEEECGEGLRTALDEFALS